MTAAPGLGVSLQSFAKVLDRLWSSTSKGIVPKRIGLAISGGVDSMALASLCSQFKQSTSSPVNFTAFVVNHNLRSGSDGEAQQVVKRLSKLPGIHSQVLTIDPVADDQRREHVEKYARTQRYRAIGIACKEAGIDTVLVAHHADDVAATILQRLRGRYYGVGLNVLRERVQIPECEHLHGVGQSGTVRQLKDRMKQERVGPRSARMWIEDGGVQIVRPLLEYSKADLVATCVNNNLSWVEDETNHDVTYTMRNTIRYLQEQDLLPEALRTSRLLKLRKQMASRWERWDAEADELLTTFDLQFDPNRGCLQVVVPFHVAERIHDHPDGTELKSRILRTLISVISCNSNLELPQFKHINDLFLKPAPEASPFRSIASVVLDVQGTSAAGYRYMITRANPFANQISSTRLAIQLEDERPHKHGFSWSKWHLWDGRYWVRVGRKQGSPPLPRNLILRHLGDGDLTRKNKKPNDMIPEHLLSGMLSRIRATKLPLHSRFCLPVLAVGIDGGADQQQSLYQPGSIVALPSLSWSIPSFQHVSQAARDPDVPWVYDIRYKKIPALFTEDRAMER